MNILIWMLFGAIGGAIAHAADHKAVRGGIAGTILLGMVGAVMGGYISILLSGSLAKGFDLFAFTLAVVMAFFLLLLHRTLLVK